MKTKKRTAIITVIAVLLLALAVTGVCEYTAWDCPECGRTGNTGNFCGGCGNPAPAKDEELSERTGNGSLTVGDTITFGTYPQTSEGTDQTPIEWIVLDIQEGKALLLSKYGLDAKPYNTKQQSITWEKCTLRNWLNNDFLKSAFNDKEQPAILVTDADNSAEQGVSWWSTTGGKNTSDQIFLLSYREASKYLKISFIDKDNTESRVLLTAYTKAQGAGTFSSGKTGDDNAAGWWWLRSPGSDQKHAARVGKDGSLGTSSVNSGDGIVRPAFWLDLALVPTTESTPSPVPTLTPAPSCYPPISVTPSIELPIEDGCWLLYGNTVDELEIHVTGGMLYIETSVINENGETCLTNLHELNTLEDGQYTLFIYSIPEIAPVGQKFIIDRSRAN